MPKLSKKQREMWEFFIDPVTKRRKYHSVCRRCPSNCKQSFQITGIQCLKYKPKNGKGRNAENQASARRKESG